MATAQAKRLPESVGHFRDRLARELGSGWKLSVQDHLTGTHEGKEHIHSLVCVASFGENLLVRFNFDRGRPSLLVGTRREADLYPFEDVAVHYGLAAKKDLHAMIVADPAVDAFAPLVSMADTIRFLAENAGELDRDFAPEDLDLRPRLRAIGDSFRTAWDRAVERSRSGKAHSSNEGRRP